MKQEYLTAIEIPNAEKGFTDKNRSYFTFVKRPLSMTDKKSYFVLVVMLILSVAAFFAKNEQAATAYSVAIIALFALYSYFNRNMHYYKKASKRFFFSDYEKMMKYIAKIVDSDTIYYKDMPLGYSLLKSKQLLENGKIAEAEKLVDAMLAAQNNFVEAMYIKGLCLYEKKCFKDSIPLMQEVSHKAKIKKMAENAQEMLEHFQPQ